MPGVLASPILSWEQSNMSGNVVKPIFYKVYPPMARVNRHEPAAFVFLANWVHPRPTTGTYFNLMELILVSLSEMFMFNHKLSAFAMHLL